MVRRLLNEEHHENATYYAVEATRNDHGAGIDGRGLREG